MKLNTDNHYTKHATMSDLATVLTDHKQVLPRAKVDGGAKIRVSSQRCRSPPFRSKKECPVVYGLHAERALNQEG